MTIATELESFKEYALSQNLGPPLEIIQDKGGKIILKWESLPPLGERVIRFDPGQSDAAEMIAAFTKWRDEEQVR